MRPKRNYIPFVIVKPYSGQHLQLLLKTINKCNLRVSKVYSTDRWSEIARKIYQKLVDRHGYEFKVGLEGHITLINYLFGNRALVLFLSMKNNSTSPEDAFLETQKVKRRFRERMLGGERLKDLIVLMNLKRVKIGCNPGKACPTGILCVKNREKFYPISKTSGKWDFYYFKYIHVPDTAEELIDELKCLKQIGVLNPQNRIPLAHWKVMQEFGTLIPPNKLVNKARILS